MSNVSYQAMLREWTDFCIDWLMEEYASSDESLYFSEFAEKKFNESEVEHDNS